MDVTEQSFLKDVAGHEMTVQRDDDLYRHVRFKRPENGIMRFDLLTWPGYLAYTGDMGTYVFSRIRDMFQFFRSEPRDGEQLRINLGYWAEKVDAEDRCDGTREYSPDLFQQKVREYLDSQEAIPEVRAAAEREILPFAHDGEHAAMTAAVDFRHSTGFRLTDFWETNCRTYTYRYVWCCYALVWGIQQYDKQRSAVSTFA